jgi:hypothetical protein
MTEPPSHVEVAPGDFKPTPECTLDDFSAAVTLATERLTTLPEHIAAILRLSGDLALARHAANTT